MSATVSAWFASVSVLLSTIAALLAAVRLSSVPRLRSLKSEVASLRSDLDELQQLLKRMDARDRMRAVRRGESPTTEPESSESSRTTSNRRRNGAPDPFTSPEEWKRHMRAAHPPIGRHTPPENS